MSVPIPFPYPPDGGQEIRESLRFSTDVLPTYSKREQRIPRRGFPGGSTQQNVTRVDPVKSAEILGLLWAHHADLWAIPQWQYAVRLASPVFGGDTFLPIDPPAAGYGLEVVPFQIAPTQAHPYVLLFESETNYQVLQYESQAMLHGWGQDWGQSWGSALPGSPSGINLVGAVQGTGSGWGLSWGNDWGDTAAGSSAFAAGSLVVPMRVGRLDEDQASSLESLEAAASQLRWNHEETAD